MKKYVNIPKSQINTIKFMREGESIEDKLRRLKITKEPIDSNMSPEYFQPRDAGVDPLCDIRTDRMALAQAAFDHVTASHIAARKTKVEVNKEEPTFVTNEDGTTTIE